MTLRGGGDRDGTNPQKNRRMRLGVGVRVGGEDTTASWGLCSAPEVCPDCESELGGLLALSVGGLLAIFIFESEAERKAPKRYPEALDLFFRW